MMKKKHLSLHIKKEKQLTSLHKEEKKKEMMPTLTQQSLTKPLKSLMMKKVIQLKTLKPRLMNLSMRMKMMFNLKMKNFLKMMTNAMKRMFKQMMKNQMMIKQMKMMTIPMKMMR